MFDQERKLFRFVLGYAQVLSRDVSDEQFGEQPLPGMNPPVWILGHLAVVGDMGLQFAGQPMLCPPSWLKDFGPGSKPLTYSGPIPSKAELLSRLERVHTAFDAVVSSIPAELLAKPQPFDPLKPGLATMADLLSHMMTTHPAMHLGQFSAWRRAMGLPSVLAI